MICLAKIVYSIYKHTTPDGFGYIGATAQKPKNRKQTDRFEMNKQRQNQGGQGCKGLPNTERGN